MVFADWTFSGDGSCELDAGTKYAGNSSARFYGNGVSQHAILTHNTFSNNQANIITWVRKQCFSYQYLYVNLSSYGSLAVTPTFKDTWQRYKTQFWYDIINDRKWGRIEKWNGSAWEQVGNDTDFGTGSPLSCTLSLRVDTTASIGSVPHTWFDEVEVSA